MQHVPSYKKRWFGLRRAAVIDVIKFIVIIGVMIWFVGRGTGRIGYNWQWYRVPRYLFRIDEGKFIAGPLLKGLKVTFQITGVSLLLSFTCGLVTALLRLSHSWIARILARGYMEFIRSTPLLVQLFCLYFVLGPVLDLSRFTSAVLALSLFEGAYASEIFRAGIVSIHKGQWEAAYSLGLSTFDMYRYVILPQALRRILPPLTSQAVSLIKDSALVSTVAIADLTMQGRIIISETFLTFELWFTVAAIYLVITIILSSLVNVMEHRFKIET